MDARLSLTDRLERYFKEREGVWIDGRELGTVAGAYGWRTRASDLRKRGMVIENRQRRMQDAITGQRWVISEYRFVKPEPVANAQPSLWEAQD